MTDSKKPLEVVFAPGCFDHLDVEDQAELDAVMQEITEMFANMTPEELAAQSRPVDWDSLDDEERQILEQSLNDKPRNLQ
jgi:TRAP-type C4-dicarboxylate transport system substrate-binding protein